VPVLSVRELGHRPGRHGRSRRRTTVVVTPTYSGCPAIRVIEQDITSALHEAGVEEVRIQTVYSPGLDLRLDPRVRPGEAQGLRHRAPGHRRHDGPRPAPPRPAHAAVPVLRLARHRSPQRVRLDRLQVDLLVPVVRAAVRGVQGDLTSRSIRRAAIGWRPRAGARILTAMTRKRPDAHCSKGADWRDHRRLLRCYNELGSVSGIRVSACTRDRARVRDISVLEEGSIEVLYKG
jgi:hypothetical protein